MADRRQVAYHPSPTAEDEQNLLRHVIEALRAGHGLSLQERSTKTNP
jgi:hypothetical protein